MGTLLSACSAHRAFFSFGPFTGARWASQFVAGLLVGLRVVGEPCRPTAPTGIGRQQIELSFCISHADVVFLVSSCMSSSEQAKIGMAKCPPGTHAVSALCKSRVSPASRRTSCPLELAPHFRGAHPSTSHARSVRPGPYMHAYICERPAKMQAGRSLCLT